MERLAKYMMDHCKTPTGVSEKAKPAIGRHLSSNDNRKLTTCANPKLTTPSSVYN